MLIALGIIAYLAVGVVLVAVFCAVMSASPADKEFLITLAVILWPVGLACTLLFAAIIGVSESVTKLSEYLTTLQERPGVGAKPDPGSLNDELP